MRLLLIAAGGALGTTARYQLGGAVQQLTSPYFPYGTFAVNVLGCMLFGVVAGLADERFVVGPTGRAFLLIGVIGGFTTFSSYTFETLQLVRAAEIARAVVNMAGQVVGGLVALWAAYAVTRALVAVP